MRNKILLPIASAILASTLVFTLPAQAEENVAATTASEVYQEDITTGLENSIIEEVYEDQAGVENDAVVEETNEENVVTPDSFLYNFKVFMEEVKLFFTFDDEKKAELLVQLANERLLEADVMAEKGDLELVKELITAYEEKITAMEELTADDDSVTNDTYDSVIEETYDNDGSVTEENYGVTDDVYGTEEESEESVLTVIYKYKLKNIAALTMVYNKVPDHVKPIIQRNLQKAIEKREAHIAKKLEKYYKKADKSVTVEVSTSVEISDTNDQAVEEVTENIVKPEKEIKVEKDKKAEKLSKKEKHLEKKDYGQAKKGSNDDVDKAKDTKNHESKSKGKGNNK